MMGPAILDYTVNGNEWDAMGYREILGEPYAPYGCYPCRGEDNWIIIACASDAEWQSMVGVIGKSSWAADAKFATKSGRKEHRDEFDRNFAEWTRKYTARQAFRLLQEAGIAAGIPSSGEDFFHDIHLRARGISSRPTRSPGARSRITVCLAFLLSRSPMRRARHHGSALTTITCSARFWV